MIMMAVVPSHIAVNLQKSNIQKSSHVTKAMAGLCLDLGLDLGLDLVGRG